MSRIVIIASDSEPIRKLKTELTQKGFDCLIVPQDSQSIKQIAERSLVVILFDTDGAEVDPEVWKLVQKTRREKQTPIIPLLSRDKLYDLGSSTDIDDFVLKPYETTEVIARIKRVLKCRDLTDSEEILKCGDLVLEPSKYEVSLCGKPVVLTFKEYQLLKFLMSNKGKVFTREVLLDKVWGWDYYGGDRTVDVHIRRLRSKIEDSTHTFIETVRGMGYRFREL